MVHVYAVRNAQLDASVPLLFLRNLNATDALHLRVALETHSRLHPQGDRLLFFCADHRLLRAEQDEGLTTFNPEVSTEAQLAALLAA